MPKQSILLIEHETHLRYILSDCLSELGGWEVTPSTSIQEGIQLCEKKRPDVILMDASAPEPEALILIEKLKQYSSTQAVPIVLISALANWLTPKEFHQMGFGGAIGKPFNPSTLSAQIFHLASLKSAKR
ncbi:response regulator [Nodosilinea sp. E11]|uniref:response regulator n=1 Tax=Nodosilinea sp. E11 TaxID=3037479 RepID=UPI0029343748|nr:response regulator [Nodosilinea sp. E11]WOD40007.1 response regulator [Nodosilinea sp. E11]